VISLFLLFPSFSDCFASITIRERTTSLLVWSMASNSDEVDEEITEQQEEEENKLNEENNKENEDLKQSEKEGKSKNKEITDESRNEENKDEKKQKLNTDEKTKSGTKDNITQKVWNKKGKNTQTHSEPSAHLTNKTHWPTPEEAKNTPGEVIEVPAVAPKNPSPKGTRSNINWVPMRDAIPSTSRRGEGRRKDGRGRPGYRGGRGGVGGGGRGAAFQNRAPIMNGAYPVHPGIPPMNPGIIPEPVDTVPALGTKYYFDPLEGEDLKTAILKQIEYYFSVDNLCRDIYFRKRMDLEGYVPLAVISNFPRVKSLSQDENFILDALENSTVLDLNSSQDKIRLKREWNLWVFPGSQVSQEQTQTNEHNAIDAQELEQHV